MTRDEAGDLLDILKVLWPNAKLPAAGDYRAVEAYKTEVAAMFEIYGLEEVRETVRELARSSEWLPAMATIISKLEAKQGTQNQKGSRFYQYDEWFEDKDGYEYVKTYMIVKGPDGGLEVPRPLQKKMDRPTLRRELLRRGILTTDDLIRMAEAGDLTIEEFVTQRGPDNRPVDGTEWKLDRYTVEPARVLAALNSPTRPVNAVLSEKNAKVVQDTVYDLFERINADFDDIPF